MTNLDIHSGLTLTGRNPISMTYMQQDWEEEALMGRLYGPLDAPTFAPAGGMWQADTTTGPIAVQRVVLLDRRVA